MLLLKYSTKLKTIFLKNYKLPKISIKLQIRPIRVVLFLSNLVYLSANKSVFDQVNFYKNFLIMNYSFLIYLSKIELIKFFQKFLQQFDKIMDSSFYNIQNFLENSEKSLNTIKFKKNKLDFLFSKTLKKKPEKLIFENFLKNEINICKKLSSKKIKKIIFRVNVDILKKKFILFKNISIFFKTNNFLSFLILYC